MLIFDQPELLSFASASYGTTNISGHLLSCRGSKPKRAVGVRDQCVRTNSCRRARKGLVSLAATSEPPQAPTQHKRNLQSPTAGLFPKRLLGGSSGGEDEIQGDDGNKKPRIPTETLLLLAAAAIGSGTGLAVTAYKLSISALQNLMYGDSVAGPLFQVLGGANIAVIPVLGGLAVALLRTFHGEPFSGGISDAVAHPTTPIDLTRPFRKAVASAFTLGTGNSLGPEQGSVDIGSVLGQWTAQILLLNPVRQQLLLAAGAASGLAAGFNAPIAGVFFALERLRIGPRIGSGGVDAAVVLLSASISALVAQAGLGSTPSFSPPVYDIRDPLAELPMWLALGALCGVASRLFRSLLGSVDSFFNNSAFTRGVPAPFLPLIGSCMCGLVALVFPQVLFFGYETLSSLLADSEDFTLPVMFALLIVKPVVTSICLGSGLVGGTVAPSLFIGALVGAIFEKCTVLFLSVFSQLPLVGAGGGMFGLHLSRMAIAGAPAYSMIGMAAVLGGILRAPLTSSLLLFELTRDYRIVIPLIAATGISSVVANYHRDVLEGSDGLDRSTEEASVSSSGEQGRTAEGAGAVVDDRKMKERSVRSQEFPGGYDVESDKAIELGLPLKSEMDKFLEEVCVEEAGMVFPPLMVVESTTLAGVVEMFIEGNHEVCVVVREKDGEQGRGYLEEWDDGVVGGCHVSGSEADEEGCGQELVGLMTLEEATAAAAGDGLWTTQGVEEASTVGSVCERDCVVIGRGWCAQRALEAMLRVDAEHGVVVEVMGPTAYSGTPATGDVSGGAKAVCGIVSVSGMRRYAGLQMLSRRLQSLKTDVSGGTRSDGDEAANETS